MKHDVLGCSSVDLNSNRLLGDYLQRVGQDNNNNNSSISNTRTGFGGGLPFLSVHCAASSSNTTVDGERGSGSNNSGASGSGGGGQNPPQKMTNHERVLTSLVAGAIAGGIAKTTIAPLDRTKIFFQTTPSSPFNLKQVLRYLYKTYKQTGFSSLWRGNSATMARIIPYAAIQFTAHEQFKQLLRAEDKGSPEVIRFVCGSLAGVTAQSLTYPLDLTRARLAVSPVSKYSSLTDVFVKTVRGEGVRGLFKGYIPTMLGVIPYAGCSFYCYEGLKRLWVKEVGEVGGVERLCFGAIAGIIGQSSSYPFDIVRRRLQTGVINEGGSSSSSNASGARVFALMWAIAKTEGIMGGLYKGLSMNWVKGPVAAGISFACYDWTQQFLRDNYINNNNKTSSS